MAYKRNWANTPCQPAYGGWQNMSYMEEPVDYEHYDNECMEEECPTGPCLVMLRETAAAERKAIAFYLDAACQICDEEIRGTLLEIAEDEMVHFVMTMRLLSCLDPVQARELSDQDLDVLVSRRPRPQRGSEKLRFSKNSMPTEEDEDEEADAAIEMPSKRDIRTIMLLTTALEDELKSINMYQCFMEQSDNPACHEHFCMLMNEEKAHVAKLIDAIYELTGEPPAIERR